jgi:hypothetical protein
MVVAVVILVLLGAFGALSFQASLESGGQTQVVTNETFTPDASNITTLSESDRDDVVYARDRAVTVRDSNGTEMQPGSDYEWRRSNGSLRTVAGGDLDGEPSANITYSYAFIDDDQRLFASLLSRIPTILGLAAPALVIIIFLRVIG